MTIDAFILEHAAFRTQDAARQCGMTLSAASHALSRRTGAGRIVLVTRGLWANTAHSDFTPYGLTPYLLGNEQGYVSFVSALQRHGVISQIPRYIYVATTGHGRTLDTPVGSYRFVRMLPRYMQYGIEWLSVATPYALAAPEKALLDCVYVSTRRGTAFTHLPEIEKSAVKQRKLLQLIRSHAFPLPLDRAIRKRCESLLA